MTLDSQFYKWVFSRVSGFPYIISIFFFVLTACSSGLSASGGSDVTGVSVGMPAPVWTQTEYIFQNRTDDQIIISESALKWKVVLNVNECVYIKHLSTYLGFVKITKAGRGELCGSGSCSNKLKASREKGEYKNFKRSPDSKEPYMEIYDIVDSSHLFKTIGSPTADYYYKKPYLARCKSTTQGSNNPPQIQK